VYAELKVILKSPIQRAAALESLRKMVGGNEVAVRESVEGTPLIDVAHLALCAEQVSSRANVVYFMAGSDTLVANIFAKSISEIREQCVRISRQLASQGLKMEKVGASILVSANGSDMDILVGEKVNFWSRCSESLKDRFLGKFLPALVTVSLTAQFMAGTPALQSAQIGLVAASVGALIDAIVAALAADNWKWKESK
jgi:hypothetical protein